MSEHGADAVAVAPVKQGKVDPRRLEAGVCWPRSRGSAGLHLHALRAARPCAPRMHFGGTWVRACGTGRPDTAMPAPPAAAQHPRAGSQRVTGILAGSSGLLHGSSPSDGVQSRLRTAQVCGSCATSDVRKGTGGDDEAGDTGRKFELSLPDTCATPQYGANDLPAASSTLRTPGATLPGPLPIRCARAGVRAFAAKALATTRRASPAPWAGGSPCSEGRRTGAARWRAGADAVVAAGFHQHVVDRDVLAGSGLARGDHQRRGAGLLEATLLLALQGLNIAQDVSVLFSTTSTSSRAPGSCPGRGTGGVPHEICTAGPNR